MRCRTWPPTRARARRRPALQRHSRRTIACWRRRSPPRRPRWPSCCGPASWACPLRARARAFGWNRGRTGGGGEAEAEGALTPPGYPAAHLPRCFTGGVPAASFLGIDGQWEVTSAGIPNTPPAPPAASAPLPPPPPTRASRAPRNSTSKALRARSEPNLAGLAGGRAAGLARGWGSLPPPALAAAATALPPSQSSVATGIAAEGGSPSALEAARVNVSLAQLAPLVETQPSPRPAPAARPAVCLPRAPASSQFAQHLPQTRGALKRRC